MPNYEYACSNCNVSFDYYRSVEERNNLPNCLYCARIETITRVIQATPTHFKTGGFYSTGG